MSTIETILSRAMSDPKFAELLFNDLDTALAEYDLSAEEHAKLKAVSRAQFEALTVEDRKSMAMFEKQIQIESFSFGSSSGY